MNNNIKAEIYKGKTKAGKDYKAIKITVGVFTKLIFPTAAEMAYVEQYLTDKAYDEFVED